ncbi:MAG: hypothetical protein QME58_01200 [Bacteroidota bacterium]|nr:hypothetical protein [Bacteroidota bacterium]
MMVTKWKRYLLVVYFGYTIFLTSIIFFSCKEKSTEYIDDQFPRLVLTADKTTGIDALTVKYTGTFYGMIDTLQMLVPADIMFPGAGKTVIIYALPDTLQQARRTYSSWFTYFAGNYKTVMLLQSKYKRFVSDTLNITVY